jgi:hypothetical protein
MKYLKRFESSSNWQEDCYNHIFDITKDKIEDLFYIFFDLSDDYEYSGEITITEEYQRRFKDSLKMEISLYIDPYEDEMYNPNHLMTIDEEMKISHKPNIDFMSSYIPSKNWRLVDESEIIYWVSISTVALFASNVYLHDFRLKYLPRIENMFKISYYNSFISNQMGRTEMDIKFKIE